MSSFEIRPRSTSLPSRTDIVDLTGSRRRNVANHARISRISSHLREKYQQSALKEDGGDDDDALSLNNSESDNDDNDQPVDHYIEIVLATKENTANVGWLITDDEDSIDEQVQIPFYDTVTEGGSFKEADWKDQPVVRQAKIRWRDDSEIAWMERHMEMTQGFLLVGKSPGLMILGEPTHDREDLTENERYFPDINRLRGYIVPAGCGIIIKKGVWHDFPVSVGPDLTVFIINTREVVEALISMEEPAPMDFGDCFKIRSTGKYYNVKLRYPDPRPIVRSLGLLPTDDTRNGSSNAETLSKTTTNYGDGMVRKEVGKWGGNRVNRVWVVPVINVEAFEGNVSGPSVQPHLNETQPEIANKGWRDYGNRQGLKRLGRLFSQHKIRCTAVVSSDLTSDDDVMSQLHQLEEGAGWEIGAHGANNTSAGHTELSSTEEENAISTCIKRLGTEFGGKKPSTWLTPGFSVSNSTSKCLLDAGLKTLLDFGDDDKPFKLMPKESDASSRNDSHLICLPYSMETNDLSLILTRNLSPREYAAALESHILQLAKEARESGSPCVVCLGMHTFVAGTPAAVYELEKMLTRLGSEENITWATAKEVSKLVQEEQCLVHPRDAEDASVEANTVSDQVVANDTIQITAKPSSIVGATREGLGLLLIDFQNDFMSPGGFGEQLGNDVSKLRRIIEPTKSVLACARLAGLTVIHTREGHRSNLSDLTSLKASGCTSIGKEGSSNGRSLIRGQWGNEIISELKPLDDSETIINKPGKGAFYQTDLELVLRNANIDTLIVCGVTTEVCVHSTVREANDRGIQCIVLEDCTASYIGSFHKVGIEMISAQGGILGKVSDSKSIIEALVR